VLRRLLCLVSLALACATGAAPAASAAHRPKKAARHAHGHRAAPRCRAHARRHARRCRAARARRHAPGPKAPAAPPAAPPVVPTTPSQPPAPASPTPVQSLVAAPAAGPLRWAPPKLVNPITVDVGNGFTRTTLSTTQDYIVKLPPTLKQGATAIVGGHNVVIVGGEVTIPLGAVDDNLHRAAIYLKGATGTVHVEGLKIDDPGGELFDGVTIAAPDATVQLENMRIVGLRGGQSSFHADVVQPWGGVRDLRIDHLTGSSDYQGLTLQEDLGPIGSAELSNVDLTALNPATLDGGGHMVWLTTGSTTCTTYPVSLSNVYVRPRTGRTLANSVWPQLNAPIGCHEAGTTIATWPALPFTGGVQAGAPASGNYVPMGAAGLGYASPGYATP